MNSPLVSVLIRTGQDVVTARQRARHAAALLGFDPQDQSRIATAVSEIARNAERYTGGGTVVFSVEQAEKYQNLLVRVAYNESGTAAFQSVLNGQFQPQDASDLGILAAQRLMDDFVLESGNGKGTTALLRKRLPATSPPLTFARLANIREQLSRLAPGDPIGELQYQNQELMRNLEELRTRQQELALLNCELEETNRGVVALYAELDERAEHLRRSDEAKSRFLSHVSHEFRTPLNSILALCKLLESHADGPLVPEQEKQIGYIRQSAESLYALVNDLLDLAKVEAGKAVVRNSEFDACGLFGVLRGMLKPLLVNENVSLIFEEPRGLPLLSTDESKLAQILRNLISNALKFTEKGEVRVSAVVSEIDNSVVFSVSDTGIGIAPEHHSLVFREFAQIDNPLQRNALGTGLGLTLSKRMAELLGGSIRLESRLGAGSTFSVVFPRARICAADRSRSRVILVVDDQEVSRYLLRQTLAGTGFEILEAADGLAAIRLALERSPDAILLDLVMNGISGFEVLRELKANPATRHIPVMIVTSKQLTAAEQSMLQQDAAAVLSKSILSQPDAAGQIQAVLTNSGPHSSALVSYYTERRAGVP
jgi:signal transduction histidine kinase/ActR/RegA family two-component response regulator